MAKFRYQSTTSLGFRYKHYIGIIYGRAFAVLCVYMTRGSCYVLLIYNDIIYHAINDKKHS